MLVTRFARRKNNEMNSACEGGYARNFQLLDDKLIVKQLRFSSVPVPDSIKCTRGLPDHRLEQRASRRAQTCDSGSTISQLRSPLPNTLPWFHWSASTCSLGKATFRSQARGFNRSLLEVLGRVFARLDQDQPVARVVAQYRLDSVGSLRWWLGEFDSLR